MEGNLQRMKLNLHATVSIRVLPVIRNCTETKSMGNEMGFPASKMGVTAIALTTPNIEQKEMIFLLGEFKKIAAEKSSEWVSRAEAEATFKKFEKSDASDLELLMNLCTLFDVNGDETLNYKDFVSGVQACITNEKIASKLKISLDIYDAEGGGFCTRGDVKKTLQSINNVASYFGDPVLTNNEVETVSFDLFKSIPKNARQAITHESCIEQLLGHPSVQTFLKGEGNVRFGGLDAPTA